MSENRSPLRIYCKNCGAPAGFDIINQTYRWPNCGESKNILKNPYDNTPVFYEMNDKGQKVPVRIRFYTLGRWLGTNGTVHAAGVSMTKACTDM